jgi:CCR4-NOT transcription complex subunit 1
MVWVELALSFVRQCLADGVAATQEFTNTFDTVSKMRPANAAVRKQLQKWLTDLRALAATKDEQKAAAVAASSAHPGAASGALSARDSSVREHVSVLLDRWLRVSANMNDQVFAQYLHLMHQYGVLKTEEAADRFFRVATELCVEACLKTAQPVEGNASATTLTFTVMDALSKLLLLLVRLADKESGDLAARVNLLSRILNAVVRTLIEDHENKKSKREVFDQRPFFRLLHNLAQDLGLPDMSQDPSPAVIALLVTYSHAYTMLVPTVVPGFAFSWLQLISQRCFMPQLLLIKGQKGWPYMHRLRMALLLFLQPFLKTVQLTDAVRKMYKGTLRVLLVVLHDFPEFLAEYHMSFCDVIPSTCVQLRNLVLSAFPKSMRLPDPFTPNLKIEMIPDINLAPRISSDSLNVLSNIRQRLDLFLQSRQPAEFPSLLPQVLVQAGVYNAPLLNALVVYLGAQGVLHMQASSPVPIESTPSMDIFKHLTTALDAEGRYLLVSAMANQLRYPNSHTRYFSTVVLLLFAEAESEYFQEQITRVLLERLIVHRPHPWGLLITFIELLKNPRYAFWRRNFTRGVPEIERVFETVARSLSGSASSGSAADGGSNAEAATA